MIFHGKSLVVFLLVSVLGAEAGKQANLSKMCSREKSNLRRLGDSCLLYCFFAVYDDHGNEHRTAKKIYHFFEKYEFLDGTFKGEVKYMEQCLKFYQDNFNQCGVILPLNHCIRENLTDHEWEYLKDYMHKRMTEKRRDSDEDSESEEDSDEDFGHASSNFRFSVMIFMPLVIKLFSW
ncbi:hypothetical protein DMENIID0001_096100 [Sergentomyia squamirostris]